MNLEKNLHFIHKFYKEIKKVGKRLIITFLASIKGIKFLTLMLKRCKKA